MAVKVVECLDWNAPNVPGELLKHSDHLRREGVNLDALWAYRSHTGESKIAAVAKKPAKLRAALKKFGVEPSASTCFYLAGKDKAGALVESLRTLADAGVNVECADAVAGQGKFGAFLWVAASDLPLAKKLLKAR